MKKNNYYRFHELHYYTNLCAKNISHIYKKLLNWKTLIILYMAKENKLSIVWIFLNLIF